MMSKAERETMDKLQAALTAAETKCAKLEAQAATQVDALNKEIAQQKSYSEMYRSSSVKFENELEAAHSLLDGLPQAPPRETEGKESYQRKDIPLTTRLASWIARVAFADAFAKAGMK